MPGMGLFDRFASSASTFVARAPFFAACVLMVVVWAPSYFLFGSLDTWQLVINTLTTIITFLLVALLQNTQERFEQATNAKLNALAEALAEVCEHLGVEPATVAELRRAAGMEDSVSA